MSHIDTGSSSNGKRSASIELNLVPFIDLMSVLITFLLITAVWTQVSMIQIGTSIYGKKTDDANPPPIPPQADIVLKLEIKPEGYFLTIEKQVVSIPLVGNEFDEVGLVAQLRKTKELYPSKIDAAVAMSDELPYERLIKGMDACLKAGFSNISVLTGGP